MILSEISLDAIDFENENFRISEDLNLQSMLASIKTIGQQNPVLLLENDPSGKIIVCGFRRLHALRRLSATHAHAVVVSHAEFSPVQAFNVALWDNLSHRVLTTLEKARVLFGLRHSCTMGDEVLINFYLPILGLEPNKKVLQLYLSIHDLLPRLRELHNEGSLTPASIERLACMPSAVQYDFCRIFEKIRLSASLQRKFLDLVHDVAAIAGIGTSEILNRPEVTASLEAPGLSQFQKGEKVCQFLYKWRNPRLSRVEEKFAADKKQLGLPDSVRLSHDPFFETRQLKVEFSVETSQQFRDVAARLLRAAQEPVLDELLRMS
jgi:hypothetical protein